MNLNRNISNELTFSRKPSYGGLMMPERAMNSIEQQHMPHEHHHNHPLQSGGDAIPDSPTNRRSS